MRNLLRLCDQFVLVLTSGIMPRRGGGVLAADVDGSLAEANNFSTRSLVSFCCIRMISLNIKKHAPSAPLNGAALVGGLVSTALTEEFPPNWLRNDGLIGVISSSIQASS